MFVKASMIPNIMYTPFEILNLIVSVEVPNIEIWNEEKKTAFEEEIKRNLGARENAFIES